jgi:outer membrane cobalamin receptor
MFRWGIAIASLAVCIAGLPSTAAGQSSRTNMLDLTLADLLNIKVTTATRTPETAATVPARVQVITAAQIQARGYRSLSDLLADLSDFKVDVAGDQDLPVQLTVQGTRGGNRIVFLLDGVRIGSPTNEPLPVLENYPVHSARQVEIVYGPASALYGADAFSAVVNIITKDATESTGLTAGVSAGRFGLFNQTVTYAQTLGSRASLVASAQLFRDAQPDMPRYYPNDFGSMEGQRTGVFDTIFGPSALVGSPSAEYNNPVSAYSLQATLRAGGLQALFFNNRSRMSPSPAYTPDNAVYDGAVYNQNELFVGSGSYTKTLGSVSSVTTVTFSRHQLDPTSGYWNVYSNMRRSFKYAYGSSVRVEEQISRDLGSDIKFTAGGVYEHFRAIPQGADVNAPVQSNDRPQTILGTTIIDTLNTIRYANTGGFAQFQYTFRPNYSLTVGGRGDYNSRFGGTVNPRVGLVAGVTPSTTVKVLFGTAYLAPSPYQEYAHWGAFYTTDGGVTYASDFWHVPNPGLKPQHKRTVELNVTHDMGAHVSASASAFRSHFTNLVRESDPDQAHAGTYLGWPVSVIEFSTNEGGVEDTYGGTLALDALHSLGPGRRISGRVSVSVADGRIKINSSVLPTPSIVPVQLRAGADVEWDGWTMTPRLAVVGDQRVQATWVVAGKTERRTIPGYVKVDVNVRRHRVLEHLDAFVLVENLLDRRYRHINARAYSNPEELVGAPQVPRRVTFGLDLRLR